MTSDDFKVRLETVERILVKFAEDHATRAQRRVLSRQEFERLPLLLSRSVFMEWAGVTSGELSRMVADGRVVPVQLHEGGRCKYRRRDLEAVAGLGEKGKK